MSTHAYPENEAPDTRPLFIHEILPGTGALALATAFAGLRECSAPILVPPEALPLMSLRRHALQTAALAEVDEQSGLVTKFCRSLGEAVLRKLAPLSPTGTRPVFIVSQLELLTLLRDFFPKATVLLALIDGRTIVARSVDNGMLFEEQCRRWAKSVRQILPAVRTERHLREGRFHIVRLEEMSVDRRSWSSLLRYTGIDGAKVGDASSFAPLTRSGWTAWEPQHHQRFNWLAGVPLRELGYSPVHLDDRGGSLAWLGYNFGLDGVHWARCRAPKKMKRFPGALSQGLMKLSPVPRRRTGSQ